MNRQEKIRAAIVSFNWSDYGLDDLDEMKESPDTSDWVTGLATHIRTKLER